MIKKIIIVTFLMIGSLSIGSVFAQDPNFATALDIATDTIPLQSSGGEIDVLGQVETRFTGQGIGGAEGIRDFVAWLALEVLIPVFVFAGIIMAIVGFFKLMTSTTDEETAKASKFILWGIIGIMIMLSAGYLTDQLVGVTNPGEGGVVGLIIEGESGGAIAGYVYDNIFFPFLRIFIFLVLGVLFIFAVINAFRYIFNEDESTKTKGLQSLIFATLGIIIIILAKSIVEAIYGSYTSVIDGESNLGEIGEGFLNNPDFTMLQNVINRALGLVTFILVVSIIYQGYMLLMTPNDENATEKLKKTFLYMFLGILIIGLAYLLVNVFIVQKT